MNRERRKALKGASVSLGQVYELDKVLTSAVQVIGKCKDEEEQAMWNLPESMDESQQHYDMEGNVEEMDSAIDKIEEARDTLNKVTAQIKEVVDILDGVAEVD